MNESIKNFIEEGEKELERVIYDSYEILDSKGKGFEQVKQFWNSRQISLIKMIVEEAVKKLEKRQNEWKTSTKCVVMLFIG